MQSRGCVWLAAPRSTSGKPVTRPDSNPPTSPLLVGDHFRTREQQQRRRTHTLPGEYLEDRDLFPQRDQVLLALTKLLNELESNHAAGEPAPAAVDLVTGGGRWIFANDKRSAKRARRELQKEKKKKKKKKKNARLCSIFKRGWPRND